MNVDAAGTETTRPAQQGRSYLWLTLGLVPLVLLAVLGRPWGTTADIWETAATIRALAANLVHPSNPLLDLPGSTSCRFTPFTLLWGAAMKATGFGVFTTLALAGVANYILFVTGVWRFIRLQFPNRALPTFVLFCMLFIWGQEYSEANEYQLGMFLITLPLVGMFAYGCTFHALAALRSFLGTKRVFDIALYAVLAATAFLTHPITGAFLFVAAFALLVTESDWRWAIALQVIPLAILVGSRLWPYFDYWTLLFQGSVEPWYRSPLFKGFVIAIGPALFGAPILIRYALKRQNLFVFWGAVFCGAIYFASLAGKVLIGGRFLFFTGFFLQVAIALYVVEHRLFRWKSMRESLQAQGFAFLIAFMLLIPALLFRTMEFGRKKPLRVTESAAPVHPFLFLRGHLHPGDIVMGADKTVWTIPALTGAKVVVPQKANPLIIEDTARRLADTRRFLYSPLSTVDRQALLHQYGATHILVDEVADADADSTLWRDVDVLSRLEAWRGHLKLYRVVPS